MKNHFQFSIFASRSSSRLGNSSKLDCPRSQRRLNFQLILACATLAMVSCNYKTSRSGEDFTRWVDQYLGTGGHGHVFMGANVPFGAVQLGPTSIPQTWDWTSGYHISDTTCIGFSHLHLSGTGIGDLSDIVLMPTTGPVNHNRGTEDSYDTGMWSYFSRANEYCAPGYYATRLDRYGVDVELTATKRVGFHKYTWPAGASEARVVVNLEDGQAWDAPTGSFVRVVDERTIEGYRYSKGWANDQRIYFVAEFSHPFYDFMLYDKNTPVDDEQFSSDRLFCELLFDNTVSGARSPGQPNGHQGEPLMVKVAVSPVSIAGAHENMVAELPGWDFEKTISDAKTAWNAELSKIKIKTADEAVKRTFYTALYHTMIAPSVFCDVNGDYRAATDVPRNTTANVHNHTNAGFTNYTTFSLWDTYRAAHPLMTVIHPEKVDDMINTMLHIFEDQGKLPVWHLVGCETDCMVGNPAIPVVADAILKGFTGFDHTLAYEAMKTSAMLDERGLNFYKQYGYIPYDKYGESVATALEYAIADWALAQVALLDGRTEDYEYFNERSKVFRHYFNPENGFLQGKSSTGQWHTPFNPFASTHREDDYTEGNAWQYTFLVPHDVDGLVSAFGGMERFHKKLDELFVAQGDMGAEASPDISGLIGQYAHGNEPSHHIIYLYSMTGRPDKAAELVRQVLSEMYRDEPDGLSGNEDVGQMSSWYILSSMGLYQPEPAGGRYYFGSPILDEAAINVGGGKTFTIKARNNSLENKYIQSITLNGARHTKPYIDFAELAAGGELVFEMTNVK